MSQIIYRSTDTAGGGITQITTGTLAVPDGVVTPVAGNVNLFSSGTGITVTGAGDTATLNVTGGGIAWNLISTGDPETKQMLNDNGYVVNTTSFTVTQFTLPTTPALGTCVEVIMRYTANNYGFWITGAAILDNTISLTAAQKYQYLNLPASPNQKNGNIKLICTDEVTKRWTVVRTKGAFTTEA